MIENHRKLALSEGWLSTGINTFLFGLKLLAGIMTGSVAIIADAWHTLSDSLTSLIVILGVKVAAKPADKEHPFGHGRAELIASLIIGVLLFVVAFNFTVESVKKMINREAVTFNTFSIVVMVVSVIFKEAIAQYSFYAARITGMEFLRADGWHHRSDSIASLLILIGIFFQKKIYWVDGFLGVIVSILIAFVAYNILKKSVESLLGKELHEDEKKEIIMLIQNMSDYHLQPHHFHLHEYGNHREITFHVVLPSEMTVKQAHQIIKEIELKIEEKTNMQVTIHVDPL